MEAFSLMDAIPFIMFVYGGIVFVWRPSLSVMSACILNAHMPNCFAYGGHIWQKFTHSEVHSEHMHL